MLLDSHLPVSATEPTECPQGGATKTLPFCANYSRRRCQAACLHAKFLPPGTLAERQQTCNAIHVALLARAHIGATHETLHLVRALWRR